MAYPKLTPITAAGATEPRYLSDHLADMATVKDFGARGDGVTDDTAAFTAAGATGKKVFVPFGVYKITSDIDGDFFSTGKAVAPHVQIKDLSSEEPPSPWLIAGDPLDIGEDIPSFAGYEDTSRWARSIQWPVVDPFDNVLYATTDPYNTSSENAYKTQMVAMHWGDNTEDRTAIGKSTPAWGAFYHGLVYVWRPTKADEPVFVCPEHPYNSDGTQVATQRLSIRMVRWDCNDPEQDPVEIRRIRLFKDAEISGDIGGLCLSCDQRILAAFAVRASDSKRIYRVWNADDVLGVSTVEDASELYVREFEAPDGVYGSGQGFHCDGKYFYGLSGSNVFYIQVMTLDGKIVFNRRTEALGIEAYKDNVYKVEAEPEGIFWAPVNGKLQMIAAATLNIYPTDDTYYYRHVRYIALTIPQTVPLHINTINRFVKDSPVFSANVRGVGNTSGNVSECFFIRNNNEPTKDPLGNEVLTGCSILKYRNNTLSPKNSSWVQHNINFRFTDNGKTTAGFALGIYLKTYSNSDNTDVQNGFFYPSEDNSATLGSSSNRWSQVYAATASISTSDEREKENIASIPVSLMRAWGSIRFKIFQFSDAVVEKGENNARLHVGLIAQEIERAFNEEGLDARKFGLFCYDEWEDEWEEDENKNMVQTRKAGSRYALRYEEALALECAYQRWRIEQLEERINQLTSNS